MPTGRNHPVLNYATQAKVPEIIRLHSLGYTQAAIYVATGVSRPTIIKVLRLNGKDTKMRWNQAKAAIANENNLGGQNP